MTPSLLLVLALLLVPAVAPAQGCPGAGPGVCEQGIAGPLAPGKAGLSPAAQKVASSLRETAAAVQSRVASGTAPADLQSLSTGAVHVNGAGEVQVYVILTEFSPERVAGLEALGLRVEIALPDERLVQGWAPAGAIDQIAALDFVREVRPPGYPVTNIGAQVTQGDAIHRANTERASPGFNGAGVKVGVMSDGVDFLASSVATGDLPSSPAVQVLSAGSGNEGTAMLEIVHDLAPGSPLAFYGPSTSADMVAGIGTLQAAGARVVVDDITFFDEPKFQDGMIAKAARNFATSGRVYATSAGNSAQRHYRATYSRTGSPGNFFHDYGGGDIGNTITIPTGCSLTVILQWNNPNGASADDFDLYLFPPGGSSVPLAFSASFQTGFQNAYEAFGYTNTTGSTIVNAFIAINEFSLVSPPSSLILDYLVFTRCSIPLEHLNSADSVLGHEAVSEVLSVAAVSASSSGNSIESYSSRGPGSISFPSPESRPVPNIAGTDCVTTETGVLGHFSNPFCGTSAAAPHVAAIAALLLQANPGLTSQQARNVLTKTSVDLGASGFDTVFGFGRADAVNAVGGAFAPPSLALTAGVNAGVVGIGQPLVASVAVTDPGLPSVADFYVGLLLPDGSMIAFLTPGLAIGSAGSLASFRPIAAGFSLAAPFSAAGTVLSYVRNGSEPHGTYTFFFLALRGGAAASGILTSDDILGLSMAPVSFP